MTRLLVVTGSRALNDTLVARAWALRELAARIFADDAAIVVHGQCKGSPDDWADELAKLARITRIAWPIDGGPLVFVPVQSFGWHVRDLRDSASYPYQGPKPRNAAMIRWAADQRDASHVVRVLALRAPWATTHGTEHTATVARRAGLDVVELVCPPECGPTDGR